MTPATVWVLLIIASHPTRTHPALMAFTDADACNQRAALVRMIDPKAQAACGEVAILVSTPKLAANTNADRDAQR